MTWNFALLAIDQLVNSAAKMRYMSGGQVGVPAVFRGPGGSALQLGAQHSQAFESYYAHIPGLKVVMPATPADAKGLLKSAIRDDNPVVFIEGEMLYNLKGEVPEGEHIVPLGKADVKRAGSDVTIICHSKTVAVALKAAEQLAAEEIDAEVRRPAHDPPARHRGGARLGGEDAPLRRGRGGLALRGRRRAGGGHDPAGGVRRARRPGPARDRRRRADALQQAAREGREGRPRQGRSPRCTRCCTATERWQPRSSWRRSPRRWRRGASSSGRRVRASPSPSGDVLAEVETDKAVMELVARAGGTLLKQVVPAGHHGAGLRAGGADRRAGRSGGERQAGAAPGSRPASPAPRAEPADIEPAAHRRGGGRPSPRPNPGDARWPRPRPPRLPPGSRIKASPLARRIAAERGIDLGGVAGSGPEGRIVLRDLEASPPPGSRARAPAGASAAPAPAPRARPVAFLADGAPFTDVPLTQLRKTIARRLAQSIGPIPDVLPHDRGGHGAGRGRRARRSRRWATGPRSRSTTSSSRPWPRRSGSIPACNAWWQDDHIRYWHEVHVSMAVAIEDGLITPGHPPRRPQVAAGDRGGVAGPGRPARASGASRPEEYTGGTFSVSNLGMLDIDEFTAVINPARGRDPCGRPDCSEAGGARGAAGRSAGGCGSRCRATTG